MILENSLLLLFSLTLFERFVEADEFLLLYYQPVVPANLVPPLKPGNGRVCTGMRESQVAPA